MKRLVLLLLWPGLVAGALAASVNWPDALKGIAAGEQVWLDKAPDLAAVADVKQAIAFEDALSSSLAKNTSGTLKTLSLIDAKTWPHMIGTDLVCGLPFEQPVAEVEDFYQRTRMALLSTDKGATCLWILEATYEEWKADNARKAK